MLAIRRPLLEQIHKHMEETYPHECCGLIIGTPGDKKAAEVFRPCRNLNEERAEDRYELDPKDMLLAEREFEEGPWDIIGIYHSHPDHQSKPSKVDTDRAWAGYSYIIGSVSDGGVESLQSWELNESERKFYEEPLDIKEEEE